MKKFIFVLYLLLSLPLVNTAFAETSTTSAAIQPVAININVADADSIADALKGIGMKKAEAIVAFREANGPFMTLNEITLVKGIGEKTLEANREYIKLK